jgi:hypothetical protein
MGPLLVEVRSVLFAVMYLLLRRLVRLLANSSKDLKATSRSWCFVTS